MRLKDAHTKVAKISLKSFENSRRRVGESTILIGLFVVFLCFSTAVDVYTMPLFFDSVSADL